MISEGGFFRTKQDNALLNNEADLWLGHRLTCRD